MNRAATPRVRWLRVLHKNVMHLNGTLLLWLTQERQGSPIAARSIGQQERVEAAA
jgi:hypothetical protein